MASSNDRTEPTKDIHEILRLRRESLRRVQASLQEVEGLQRQFEADRQNARNSNRYPVKRLESVATASVVKLMSIEPLKISLTFYDNTLVEIEYPSAETLSDDLRAWSQSATPDDLKRLHLPPGIGPMKLK